MSLITQITRTEKYGYENRLTREHSIPVYGDEDIKEGDRVYVTLYTTTRHFGGHEEGGWYQNWNTREWSIPTLYSVENVINVIKTQEGRIKSSAYGDIYSCSGGQSAFVRVEYESGLAETREADTWS